MVVVIVTVDIRLGNDACGAFATAPFRHVGWQALGALGGGEAGADCLDFPLLFPVAGAGMEGSCADLALALVDGRRATGGVGSGEGERRLRGAMGWSSNGQRERVRTWVGRGVQQLATRCIGCDKRSKRPR